MRNNIKLIFCLLLPLILTGTLFPQEGWFQQISGTTNDLWAVSFTDEYNGTVVGDLGTILRTTDGGTNWFNQYSGTSNDLFGVSFTDINNGTVVGGWGTILRTTDGGTFWFNQYSGVTNHLYEVCFTDANTGTAVGLYGIILRTTNGGASWITQTNPYVSWLEGVSFTDSDNGTAVGAGGHILRTTNGGQNWVSQWGGTGYSLWGVSFTDPNNGTTVGLGGIFRTTDGGTNWINQLNNVPNLRGVSFIDINNGTAVGSNGTILRTTDAGTNWISQASGLTNTLYGVSFTDFNYGTAVGELGIILRTTNGGGIPVELFSFTAFVNENNIELKWSTATETNNRGFEILRSSHSDNKECNKIGFVPGHGTTTETQHYIYTDSNVKPGKYQYKLKQIDYDGSFEYSQIVEGEIPLVNEFSLSQNYPNPFNPSTKIKYTIPSVGTRDRVSVQMKVYDVLGNEIATLVNEEKQPGTYEIEFNSSSGIRNLVSGIYFYQLKAGNFIETKKMVLLR